MTVSGDLFEKEVAGLTKNLLSGEEVRQSTIPPHPPLSWKEEMLEKYGIFPVSENSLTVLKRRYLKRDEEGNIQETPEDMVARVSYNIALAEDLCYEKGFEEVLRWAEAFYELINSLEFMPNSPTLMNAGKELQQLSACFVLPVEDSMESIFDAVKNTALIHKSGGGTGFSFSRLRPTNDVVRSTKGISSGPISFMTVFDAATETIKQGGTRRGANMGILRVDHPDILDFITCKEDNYKLNNFNISVALTEEFMDAVEDGREYTLFNPHSQKVTGSLNAGEVFEKIVSASWRNGEPGIIFLDRINRDNPTPQMGEIESTNPCGEQPLLPFESCNLGSINLSTMVSGSGDSVEIDFDKLRNRVYTAIRFLDNVIDMNNYPLPEISIMTKGNRKIGLGVMGFADMLLKLKVPYNSSEALEIASNTMGFIQEESKIASRILAEERGPFPNFPHSIYGSNGNHPLRNATTTTIAPTGTISIISSCSSGIEPLFALVFERNVMDNDRLLEANGIFSNELERIGLYSEELMERVAKKNSIDSFEEIPDEMRQTFVTAFDVSPEWHLRMQAAFQEHVDNAVSKTVNFGNEATEEDIREVFMLAYSLGCKGVTVYRDGSRDQQVLTLAKDETKDAEQEDMAQVAHLKVVPRPRPESLTGTTKEMHTGCGKLYVTINRDELGLFEIFNQMGKAGGCASSQSEAIGRLVSLAVRSGVDPREVIKQLKGISCQKNSWDNGDIILSCADAVAKSLEWYLSTFEHILPSGRETRFDRTPGRGACPDCGSHVEMQEGCLKCRSCGYSEC
jgi:ribonucleoside-diphosphate reductase alpha chain